MKEKFKGFLLGDFQGMEHCFPIGIDTFNSHFSSVADFISVYPCDLITLVFEEDESQ